METTSKEIRKIAIDILTGDFTFTAYLISSISLVAALFIWTCELTLVGLSLVFVVIDIYVWSYIFCENPNNFEKIVYRIIQIGLQVSIAAALCQYGWRYAAAFGIFWLFGIFDLLYYLLQKDIRYIKHNWYLPWLYWTPLGWVKTVKGREMLAQAIVGLVLGGALIW